MPHARLVARAGELGQLHRHLDAALAGQTSVAFVSGDAGSGKTTLLEAFASSAMAECPDLLVAGTRCSPGGSLDAFAPLRKLAELLFGDLASEAAWRLRERDQLDRLGAASDLLLAALHEHGPDLVDTLVSAASVARRARLVANSARTERILPGRDSFSRGDIRDRPPVSQTVLFDQLTCTLAAIASRQPLLLLLDDLHWVDNGTAASLLHLGRELGDGGAATGRVLVLGAYRSATVSLGRRDPYSGEVVRHPLASVINELRRAKGEILVDLDRADGRAFVEALVDTDPNRLGAGFRDALYARTGGHALFTVESLRNLEACGELYKDEAGRWVARESLDWGSLPARVEATIAERIERLPDRERRILSTASVQGDDFSGEVVAELIGSPAGDVSTCLSSSLAKQHHLVHPEGLRRLGSEQHSTYRFTHHLFQKYLYEQLDTIERAKLHAAVAACLDRGVGGEATARERLASRLSWHYEAGGLPLPAARCLLDAGRQAMQVSAFREALGRFDHGLELLANEPPSAERAELERLLEVARLGPERNLDGIGSASYQSTLARAAAAWAGQRGRPQLMLVIAEAEAAVASGRLENALAAAERLRAEALQAGEEDGVGLARLMSGMAHHLAGNIRESESHLVWVLAWLKPEQGRGLRAATGIDLGAQALAFLALNEWLLGTPEQALAHSQEALATARAAGAAVGEAAALALGATLLIFLRLDWKTATEKGEQCLQLCARQGIGMWRVLAEVLLGRLMVDRGEDAAGVERMHAALAAWRAMGMVIASDVHAALLADGCLVVARRHGPSGDGVNEQVLAIGLAAIQSMIGPQRPSDTSVYEAELHRLRGELLLARDGLAAGHEASACFDRALELGRKKGALAWELRAGMSIVRLRERQGESCAAALVNAREHLRETYERFTEGFCFPDLQDAAALIGNRPDQRIGQTES